MKLFPSALALTSLVLAATASPLAAIKESTCPTLCTPSCPCSIVCQDEFGRNTTCGEYGEPCTVFSSTGNEEASPEWLLTVDEPVMTPAVAVAVEPK